MTINWRCICPGDGFVADARLADLPATGPTNNAVPAAAAKTTTTPTRHPIRQAPPTTRSPLPQTFDDSVKFSSRRMRATAMDHLRRRRPLAARLPDQLPPLLSPRQRRRQPRGAGRFRNHLMSLQHLARLRQERGWGIRRFQFDPCCSTTSSVAAPGELSPACPRWPETFPSTVPSRLNPATSVSQRLRDLQATCTYETTRWTHLLGVGVRYTSMSQTIRRALSLPPTTSFWHRAMI